MILIVCSVRDRAVDAFMRPIFVPAAGAAIRSFSDEVNRVSPENEMNRHPSDYDLYELGQFDDQTGILSSHSSPRVLMRGQDCKVSNS